MSTKVINNEISQGGDFNVNTGNVTYAEYKNGSMDSTDDKLAYLKNLDASSTIYNPVNEINKSWDKTARGLTQTSQILIAVVASAAIIATGGAAAAGAAAATSAGATAGGVVAGAAAAGTAAGASAAASIATVSATNASMNDNGNFFRSLDDVGKITLKDTTSKDSMEKIAIASLSAALTAGALQATGITPTGAASGTTRVSSPTITVNATNAVATTGFGTISYTLSSSLITGDSLSKTIEAQGGAKEIITNTVVMALAEMGAQQIGRAYHGETTSLVDSTGKPLTNIDGSIMTTGSIGKPTQLALHAGLGCASSSAMGGNCGAGAVGAVVGEMTGEFAKDNLKLSREASIGLASVTSASASLLASRIQGKDDEHTAKNTQLGSVWGSNAAENNATYVNDKKILNYPKDKDYNLNIGVQYSAGPITVNHGTDGTGVTINTIPSLGIGGYVNYIPRGENGVITVNYGIKGVATFDVIGTDKTNVGYGGTFGYTLQPPIGLGFNSAINVDFNNKKEPKK